MQRFWEIVIQPCLAELHPKHIIEIGSDTGGNTIKILQYCLANDCRFTAIDPVPQFDYQTLEQQSGGRFRMVTDLSLNALPTIDGCDVALIDGDHNWYTVYHELQNIYLKNQQQGRAFPVIFFHDTDWPYGRRDMYYDPSNIPSEYQQPHAQGGILIGRSELQGEAGLNAQLYNALHEGGEKNGVLTAIEDFVRDSDLDLVLYSFAGLYGFSVLFENNAKYQRLFSPFEIQKRIAVLLEKTRLYPYL